MYLFDEKIILLLDNFLSNYKKCEKNSFIPKLDFVLDKSIIIIYNLIKNISPFSFLILSYFICVFLGDINIIFIYIHQLFFLLSTFIFLINIYKY
jgi:hypothetical protein